MDAQTRYNFLIAFTRQHPLSNGRRGFREMVALKRSLTGLSLQAAVRAVSIDLNKAN